MPLQPFQSFFRQFGSLYRPFILKVGEVLAKFNLTVPQWSVIRLLAEEGEMTPAELANRQNVEKPTISRTLQQLLENGLITSKPGRDRREKIIFLSEAGEASYKKAVAAITELERTIMGDIPEKDQLAMLERFAEMQQNLMK